MALGPTNTTNIHSVIPQGNGVGSAAASSVLGPPRERAEAGKEERGLFIPKVVGASPGINKPMRFTSLCLSVLVGFTRFLSHSSLLRSDYAVSKHVCGLPKHCSSVSIVVVVDWLPKTLRHGKHFLSSQVAS